MSATSRAASPTARHGRPNAACSASAPLSSTRNSGPAAGSTYASCSSGQLPTSPKRSALCLTSRALAAPGSKPPRASRPTASTTPSPTPATHSDHPRPTSASGRTGNAPTTTSNAHSETSVTTSPANTRTRSETHIQQPPAAAQFRRLPPCREPQPRRLLPRGSRARVIGFAALSPRHPKQARGLRHLGTTLAARPTRARWMSVLTRPLASECRSGGRPFDAPYRESQRAVVTGCAARAHMISVA